MKYCLKVFATVSVLLYLISIAGCATAPEKTEVSEKDLLIQNLTEENAVLRGEIDRLTEELEALGREKYRLQKELKTQEELKLIK